MSFFGKKVTATLDAEVNGIGESYTKLFYCSDDYAITLHKETGEILGIESFSDDVPITASKKTLESEEDFIAYARSVAEKFASVKGYSVSVEYEEAPPENVRNNYCGDRYIFSKQLNGFDTNERVVVSIMPNGGVYKIERTGMGEFEDFRDVALDREKLEAAIAKTASLNSFFSDFYRANSVESRYYLINDGGTLCALIEATYSLTPVDVEASHGRYETVFIEEQTFTTNVKFVMPLAEVVS